MEQDPYLVRIIADNQKQRQKGEMITQQLRDLEKQGIVLRNIIPEVPPKVAYFCNFHLRGDEMDPTEKTLAYYNTNADDFAARTASLEFTDIQTKFLNKLKKNSYILDFGCGSGRDTKFFSQQGFRVCAIDGSPKLCEIAHSNTGIAIKQMLFQELDAIDRYDRIWACSSILHLPKTELHSVMRKMVAALKDNGIIYTSFKYGSFEGERNGRYFTYFTETTFEQFLADVKNIRIEELWITSDVRTDRGDEKWLNLILRKL